MGHGGEGQRSTTAKGLLNVRADRATRPLAPTKARKRRQVAEPVRAGLKLATTGKTVKAVKLVNDVEAGRSKWRPGSTIRELLDLAREATRQKEMRQTQEHYSLTPWPGGYGAPSTTDVHIGREIKKNQSTSTTNPSKNHSPKETSCSQREWID